MRMGRVVLGIGCATLVLWRILVVGINNVAAIRASRWIDSSIWLTEDPLAPFELAIATLIVPAGFSDQVLMYAAELLGVVVWSVVALIVYWTVRRARFVAASDAVILRPITVATLAVLAALFGYVGGCYRLSLARALDVRSLSLVQVLAILTFEFVAALPLVGFMVWRRARK